MQTTLIGPLRSATFIICSLLLTFGAATALADGSKGWKKYKPKRPKTVELQILAINDYHGHVGADTPGTVDGVAAGGSEFLSTKLQMLRQGKKHSLTVAAGDLIGASPFFSGFFHDEPAVESLNIMGLDIASVGNHEFDEGVAELLRMQRGGCHPQDGCYFEDAPYAGAEFKWLAANVVNKRGRSLLAPIAIRFVSGVPVAFIGMTLESTDTLVAAAGIKGFRFLDEVDTANKWARLLSRFGVKAIVVLLHEGGITDTVEVNGCSGISGPIVDINAGLSAEIDAVITGHTHLPYNCTLPDPQGTFRPVTSAHSFGRVVTEMKLHLDRRTRDVRRNLTTVTNHVVDQSMVAADPALTAVIDKWAPLADNIGSLPVGQIVADINRGGVPTGSDRGVESAAGNLVADAQLWATSAAGAVVAFMNPGGVRSDLTFAPSDGEGEGVVLFSEAQTFQPFGNTLQTLPMSGAQVQSVLEQQCQTAGASRPVLHLGVSEGFTYDLSVTVTDGVCTGVSVSNVQIDGVALDAAETYFVTVNSFLADGGDNFTTFAEVDAALRIDGGVDLDALVNYMAAFSPVAPPSTDRVNEI